MARTDTPMHPIPFLPIICAVLIFLLGTTLQPQPARGSETIRSGVSPTNPQGMNQQLTQWVARTLDMTLESYNCPFKRRLAMMKTGELDLMVGLFKRPDREGYIHYLAIPYRTRSNRIFWVLKGKESMIRTYEDLYGLKIGTTLGAKYFHRFDTDRRLTKDAVRKMELNLQKLVCNRLDAVIAPESSGIKKMQRLGLKDRIGMADYVYSEENPVYVGISKKSVLMQRITEVEDRLVRAIESGEAEEIMRDYYRQQGLPVPTLN